MPTWQGDLLTPIAHFIKNNLHFSVAGLCSVPQIRYVRINLRQLWQLSFSEALLIRLGYIIAYFMLICSETIAFTLSLTRLPRPAKILLTCAIGLVVALCCSTS
jgi:hypothetical protein